jgi:hypothetical protein
MEEYTRVYFPQSFNTSLGEFPMGWYYVGFFGADKADGLVTIATEDENAQIMKVKDVWGLGKNWGIIPIAIDWSKVSRILKWILVILAIIVGLKIIKK